MKFGRYKNFNWAACWKRRKAATRKRLAMDFWPDAMWEMEARMILEAYHRGPWRAIRALVKHELLSVWMWYGWPKWEWTRVHILRRKPDSDLAEFERFMEEQDAIEEAAKEL